MSDESDGQAHKHFADAHAKSAQAADHVHSVGLSFKYCPLCATPLELRRHEHDAIDRPRCMACGYVHYLDPKVSACTISQVDGKVVLLKRAIHPEKGKWVFPGGFVDRGEPVTHAAIRETKEEILVDVEIERLFNVYSYERFEVVVVVYLCRIVAGQPHPGPEASEVRLFPPNDIPWNDLAFRSTTDALRDWAALQLS